MTVQYEVMKVEEVEGSFEVGADNMVTCPMCAGYTFNVSFDTGHHVDLHCLKCQAIIHLKTVSGI